MLFQTGIYIISQDSILTLVNIISFSKNVTSTTPLKMDINNNSLVYSIDNQISLLNLSNIFNIFLTKTILFPNSIDEIIFYLPYLLILSNNYMIQYDLDLNKSMAEIYVINVTNTTNTKNFMMKWFYGTDFHLITEGGLFFFQFNLDDFYFLNSTAC